MKKVITTLLLASMVLIGTIVETHAASYLNCSISSNQTISKSSEQILPPYGQHFSTNSTSSNKYLYSEIYRNDPFPIPDTLISQLYISVGGNGTNNVTGINTSTKHYMELNPAGPSYSGCIGSGVLYF